MCFIATDVQEKERKQGIMLYNKFPKRLMILNVTWADVINPADVEFASFASPNLQTSYRVKTKPEKILYDCKTTKTSLT